MIPESLDLQDGADWLSARTLEWLESMPPV
jgi:hypothetical protein